MNNGLLSESIWVDVVVGILDVGSVVGGRVVELRAEGAELVFKEECRLRKIHQSD